VTTSIRGKKGERGKIGRRTITQTPDKEEGTQQQRGEEKKKRSPAVTGRGRTKKNGINIPEKEQAAGRNVLKQIYTERGRQGQRNYATLSER